MTLTGDPQGREHPAKPTVSVIVVSRGRADSLARTLTGLSRLTYPSYEIVTVADAEGLRAVRRQKMTAEIKMVPFADPNISQARNLGIAVAAGEIIAFIDDDAVPEPTWLDHLVAPFADAQTAAAGGFVRGRNGISFQWKAQNIDHTGRCAPLEVDETRATLLTPPPGFAIKTEGTNMAFRRATLAGIGGFDPAFRFYLDETDVNMRLAKARHATAIAPLAEVHHAFAPSTRRHPSRAPRDLFEIGASLAVFLRKHCPEIERPAVWDQFRAERNKSLLDHMVHGRLEPGDVRRLRRRLVKGYAAGLLRDLNPMPAIPHAAEPFLTFDSRLRAAPEILSGRSIRKRSLRKRAAELAQDGVPVSLFLFSPTTLFHRVRMRDDGSWEQTGGLFGKSDRSDPPIRVFTRRARLRREISRVAAQRGLPHPQT